MSKIRTGIIRCDLHATYYAPLMQEHDVLALREPEIGVGGYFYHYLMFNDPEKLTTPKVWDFEITKVWDEDRELAENLAKILFGKPKVCDTFEEVSDDVDLVFIPDCELEGKDHLRFATPGIQKGVPTFVDKPFAYEAADARKMVEMARERNVPIFSRSILHEVPQTHDFRSRFRELHGAKFGIIKGGRQGLNGLVHALSLAVALFGYEVETVEAMGQDPYLFAHLLYGQNPDRPEHGVTINGVTHPTYHCSYYASAYSEMGSIHSPNIGDFEFPFGAARILEKVSQMVRTGTPPESYDEMVELIAIATAIRKSLAEKRPVRVSEV